MIENGVDIGPLAGWVIAFESGLHLIGKWEHDPERLEPVYWLSCGAQLGPQGQLAYQRQCFPVLTFASITGFVLTHRPMLEVQHLSRNERADLARAVAVAEQITKAMRGAESGVVIATDMPKIDPKAILRKP